MLTDAALRKGGQLQIAMTFFPARRYTEIMVMRVQRVGEEFGIVLSEDAMRALHLIEGAEVELLPVAPGAPVIEYLTNEEALRSFRATLPTFRADYEELAK